MAPTPPTAGQLFWLAPGLSQLGDPITHPHAVLATPINRPQTLVQGSTQPTVVSRTTASACCLVKPDASNGLRQDTWFLGCVLARVAAKHLRSEIGVLSPSDIARVRTAVRASVGVGTGIGLAPGPALRGRVVRLEAPMAKPTIRWAVVLTECAYSARNEFQVIVPLVDAAERAAPSGNPVIASPLLASATGGDLREAFAAVELVQSVWGRKHIAVMSGQTLDGSTVDDIARAAQAYLGVP